MITMDLVAIPQFLRCMERVYRDAGTQLSMDCVVVTGQLQFFVTVHSVGSRLKEYYHSAVFAFATMTLQQQVWSEVVSVIGRRATFAVSEIVHGMAEAIRVAKRRQGRQFTFVYK